MNQPNTIKYAMVKKIIKDPLLKEKSYFFDQNRSYK